MSKSISVSKARGPSHLIIQLVDSGNLGWILGTQTGYWIQTEALPSRGQGPPADYFISPLREVGVGLLTAQEEKGSSGSPGSQGPLEDQAGSLG